HQADQQDRAAVARALGAAEPALQGTARSGPGLHRRRRARAVRDSHVGGPRSLWDLRDQYEWSHRSYESHRSHGASPRVTTMHHPRVILPPRRARPFYARHPWVFAGAIAQVDGAPADGDVVDLYSHGDHFIARGFYNSKSKIRVRLYSWSVSALLDRDFFRQRLQNAIELRRTLGLDGEGEACRLVFSEADGLSGLAVD